MVFKLTACQRPRQTSIDVILIIDGEHMSDGKELFHFCIQGINDEQVDFAREGDRQTEGETAPKIQISNGICLIMLSCSFIELTIDLAVQKIILKILKILNN